LKFILSLSKANFPSWKGVVMGGITPLSFILLPP
jgi:hypothetical protein